MRPICRIDRNAKPALPVVVKLRLWANTRCGTLAPTEGMMGTFFNALKYLIILRWQVWRHPQQVKAAH